MSVVQICKDLSPLEALDLDALSKRSTDSTTKTSQLAQNWKKK